MLGFGPELTHESGDGGAPTGGGSDVLASIDGIADGGSAVAAAGGEGPELAAGFGVEGEEVAFGVAGEDEVAGSGQDRGQKGVFGFVSPFFLASYGVIGVQVPTGFAVGSGFEGEPLMVNYK